MTPSLGLVLFRVLASDPEALLEGITWRIAPSLRRC
jgi:hypothetical protein